MNVISEEAESTGSSDSVWSSSSSGSTGSFRDFVVGDDEVLSEEPQTPPPRSDRELLYDRSMSPPATRGRSLQRTHRRDMRRFVDSDSARQRSLDLYRALESDASIASPDHLEAEIAFLEHGLESLRRQLETYRHRRLFEYPHCSTCRRKASISSETVVSDSTAPDTTDLSGAVAKVNPTTAGEESDGPLLRLRSTRRLKA